MRDALVNDEIRQLEIWYVHNLPESVNVKAELKQAAKTADSLIKNYFSDAQVDTIGIEIGRGELEELYRRTEAPIAVSDEFTVKVPGGFETSSDRWKAFTTAVPVTWLREVWLVHEGDRMSPNVRDYLGIVRSERNINNGIKTTASTSPEQFWIYNNGLTILVHEFASSRGTRDCELDRSVRQLAILGELRGVRDDKARTRSQL